MPKRRDQGTEEDGKAVDELTEPEGLLQNARLHGDPVGCGALKLHDDEPYAHHWFEKRLEAPPESSSQT